MGAHLNPRVTPAGCQVKIDMSRIIDLICSNRRELRSLPGIDWTIGNDKRWVSVDYNGRRPGALEQSEVLGCRQEHRSTSSPVRGLPGIDQ
jgi:hypothetical protein